MDFKKFEQLDISYSLINNENAVSRCVNIGVPFGAGVLVLAGQWVTGVILLMILLLTDLRVNIHLGERKKDDRATQYVRKKVNEYYA